jgi:glycosyltransferase involved in cell wall biosynthesis
MMLDAVGRMGPSSPADWSLKIAGMGDRRYLDHLVSRCRSGGLQNVEFLGALSLSDLRAVSLRSRAAVAPSLGYENMPNAVLENLSWGTPVIAPRHGSFPELVGDGERGLLFTPGDVEDLASKMRWMLDNMSEAERMGKNAFEFINKHHTPKLHYELLMASLRQQ